MSSRQKSANKIYSLRSITKISLIACPLGAVPPILMVMEALQHHYFGFGGLPDIIVPYFYPTFILLLAADGASKFVSDLIFGLVVLANSLLYGVISFVLMAIVCSLRRFLVRHVVH